MESGRRREILISCYGNYDDISMSCGQVGTWQSTALGYCKVENIIRFQETFLCVSSLVFEFKENIIRFQETFLCVSSLV
jgi:hypothetical protein